MKENWKWETSLVAFCRWPSALFVLFLVLGAKLVGDGLSGLLG